MTDLTYRPPPRLKWQGQGIRVEHLVAPAGWLTRPGTHLASCNCQCANVQTCPECGQPSWPQAIAGRWDAKAGRTARPFDAVWVRLGCGCEFGDQSLSRPATLVNAPAEDETTPAYLQARRGSESEGVEQ